MTAQNATLDVASTCAGPRARDPDLGAEKRLGHHSTQKPLRLVRRALLACTREGGLVFDPFCGSGTTGVAAKELGRAFVGAELEEGYAALAGRRISAAERGGVLREVLEHRRSDAL
jgi:site-specific DNA-methyltransferase (adenine-specific)